MSSPELNGARHVLIEKARAVIVRALQSPPPGGYSEAEHRFWGEVVSLSRLARDMVRAVDGLPPGSEDSPNQEWILAPQALLQRCADGSAGATTVPEGETITSRMAEALLREKYPIIARRLS